MDYNIRKNSDLLSSLPTDKSPPTNDEIQAINLIFKQNKTSIGVIFSELKESLLVGILFILFCIPQIDDLIKRFIPITQNSVYILILLKSILVMCLFWILKHFYLAKKKS
jgi:hypothetical protein